MSRGTFDTYQDLKWKGLLRENMGPAGALTDAAESFSRIKKLLDRFASNAEVRNSIAQRSSNEIERWFKDFLAFTTNTISTYSDVKERERVIQAVKDKEAELGESLNKYLYLFPEESALSQEEHRRNIEQSQQLLETERQKYAKAREELEVFLGKIPDATGTLEDFIENESTLTKAIDQARQWTEEQEKAIASIMKRNQIDAATKAQEHKTFYLYRLKTPKIRGKRFNIPVPLGSYPWLLASLLFGAFTFFVTILYAFDETDLNLGAALLRMSSVVIPAFFALFCVQQFSNHRRLYEAYRFKDLSLQTMIDLRKRLTRYKDEDRSEQKILLEKSLSVIFHEPYFRDETKMDKAFILEVIRLAKENTS